VAILDRDPVVDVRVPRAGAGSRDSVVDVTKSTEAIARCDGRTPGAERLDIVVNNAGITGRSYRSGS